MTDEHAPELDVTHVRQARRGRHAFIILVTSLTLVVIAFTVVFLTHTDEFAGQKGSAPGEVARTYDEQPAVVKQTATAEPGSVPAGG
jgi:hypothetical protein